MISSLEPLQPLLEQSEWQSFMQASSQSNLWESEVSIVRTPYLEADFSYQPHSGAWLKAGQQLLDARKLGFWRAALFAGEKVNTTEMRAAWHTELRVPEPLEEIQVERDRMKAFAEQLDTKGNIQHIVHIGIGGSDWGPRLALHALGTYGKKRKVRYVSNIDAHDIESALRGLNPANTLVVISSKSFTTTETMHNATYAIEWLKKALPKTYVWHLLAVTAHPDRALAFGVPENHIFRFWNWVGGRYSIWSAVALPLILTLGYHVYERLLDGAHQMDQHFIEAPIEENIPVRMALVALYHRHVQQASSLNIAAYDRRLRDLAPYLQQLEMESLGKSVDREGNSLNYTTGGIVWGMPGTDAQHTFFQWLHQAPESAPVDFIMCLKPQHKQTSHHQLLLANCLAQRQVLWHGAETEGETQKRLPGKRASTLLVMPSLSPESLGSLIAAYEHKVFVQSVVWGINPFDQWGVEAGKVMAQSIVGKSDVKRLKDASLTYWLSRLGM